MTKRGLATMILLASLSLVVPSLIASQDKPDNDDAKWQTKGNYQYRSYPLRPLDWPQGVDTSWDNCGNPPGRKGLDGCKSMSYEGHYIYYYTGKDGTVYARRPVNRMYQPHDTAKDATK
jgi:hypothetical protein